MCTMEWKEVNPEQNKNFVEDGKGVQTWQKECCYWIIYLQDVVIVH